MSPFDLPENIRKPLVSNTFKGFNSEHCEEMGKNHVCLLEAFITVTAT